MCLFLDLKMHYNHYVVGLGLFFWVFFRAVSGDMALLAEIQRYLIVKDITGARMPEPKTNWILTIVHELTKMPYNSYFFPSSFQYTWQNLPNPPTPSLIPGCAPPKREKNRTRPPCSSLAAGRPVALVISGSASPANPAQGL